MGTSTHPALDAWLRGVDGLLAEAAQTEHHQQDDHKQNERPMLIGKLWVKLDKERDLELHLRSGWIVGVEYLQLADFQPSTGRYENAVLIEHRFVGRLLKELSRPHRYAGGTAGSLR